jgi:hypothetical protein
MGRFYAIRVVTKKGGCQLFPELLAVSHNKTFTSVLKGYCARNETIRVIPETLKKLTHFL